MTTITYRRKGNHYCKDCESFKSLLQCSEVQVKNAQPDTEYCLWGTDRFIEKKNDKPKEDSTASALGKGT